MSDQQIRQAAKYLHDADVITILTGAGASKESGVPTFRDALEGLWAQYNPQQLATRDAFRANPKLVWDWYEWRRQIIRDVIPNAGHIALARLAARHQAVHLITQNVDDLHERGGSSDVIHLHGNIAQNKCFDDCQGTPTLIELDGPATDSPPHCPHCNTAYVRPNVVWFGEMLPRVALSQAEAHSIACDVMLVIGTSGMVAPASSLPLIARQYNATIIEINPSDSTITPFADLKFDSGSAVTMPKIIEAYDAL